MQDARSSAGYLMLVSLAEHLFCPHSIQSPTHSRCSFVLSLSNAATLQRLALSSNSLCKAPFPSYPCLVLQSRSSHGMRATACDITAVMKMHAIQLCLGCSLIGWRVQGRYEMPERCCTVEQSAGIVRNQEVRFLRT